MYFFKTDNCPDIMSFFCQNVHDTKWKQETWDNHNCNNGKKVHLSDVQGLRVVNDDELWGRSVSPHPNVNRYLLSASAETMWTFNMTMTRNEKNDIGQPKGRLKKIIKMLPLLCLWMRIINHLWEFLCYQMNVPHSWIVWNGLFEQLLKFPNELIFCMDICNNYLWA